MLHDSSKVMEERAHVEAAAAFSCVTIRMIVDMLATSCSVKTTVVYTIIVSLTKFYRVRNVFSENSL